jgi:hypothetical protein
MASLDDKLSADRVYPFRDVPVCRDSALLDERDAALATLMNARTSAVRAGKQAEDGSGDTRLGKSAQAPVKAAERALADVEERIRAASFTIRIIGVHFGKYNEFVARNPGRKGHNEGFNPNTFFMYVARKTGKYVDDDGNLHDITSEQWDRIEKDLTDAEHDAIASAVIAVNRQDSTRGSDFFSKGSAATVISSEQSEPQDN